MALILCLLGAVETQRGARQSLSYVQRAVVTRFNLAGFEPARPDVSEATIVILLAGTRSCASALISNIDCERHVICQVGRKLERRSAG